MLGDMAPVIQYDIYAAHALDDRLQEPRVGLGADVNGEVIGRQFGAGRIDVDAVDGGFWSEILAPQLERASFVTHRSPTS